MVRCGGDTVRLDQLLDGIARASGSVLIGTLALFVAYRLAIVAIERLVPRLAGVQADLLGDVAPSADALAKRIATIQDLLRKLARAAVLVGFAALVLESIGQPELAAGVGLVVVTFLFASQSIVLDYVMGLMILLEDPYSRGDWLRIATSPPLEGEVTEVGLRRTILRDSDGALHSVSNGLVRAASNFTRGYSVARAEVTVIHARDLERALAVARDVASDTAMTGSSSTARPEVWVIDTGSDGGRLRVMMSVLPGLRLSASSELRRRLVQALVNAAIPIHRSDTPTALEVTTVA
jgi:moderate conductance mechanosensitive channel